MNETDSELLEWAAKAARIEYTISKNGTFLIAPFENPLAKRCWNPLTDDGDALRLAVKLRLEIGFPSLAVVWSFGRNGEVCREMYTGDPLAATRRAIVRAAAEIGKTMP